MVGAPAKPTPTPPPPAGKPRPNPPAREPGAAPRRPGQPAAIVRAVISLVLLWHLSAVVLAPMSVPPSSQIVQDIAQGRLMQWYLDALYINHGYYFFAPDPGAGRLIYFDVFDARGNPIKQGKFPDWDMQWPRLWYHRHFMLADQVGAGLPEVQEGTEAPDTRGQRRFLEAYARQLLRQYKGESVRVRWVVHEPLDPFKATHPARLDTPESYKVQLEATQHRSDLGPEAMEEATPQVTKEPDVATRWMGVRR